MAIEKNSLKVTRIDAECNSPHSRDTLMSSDDEDFQRRNSVSAAESDDDDDDDEFDDCDSGAGSDDFDLLELGETGEEFCQIADQTCSIPHELYDLPGLKDVLSMDVWNEVLTEEERFGLAKYLPDLDQESFVCTMKELFSGDNLHFGSPIDKLFDMLKGGLCEPRVALYRQGLDFFQRTTHYHNLRDHQNNMVNNLCQIRDAWLNCKGYSIEEKLRVLNIMKSQKSLMNENLEEFENDSSDKEDSADGLWARKTKDRKLGQKTGRYSGYNMGPATDIPSHGRKATTDSVKHGKQNPRGTLKVAGSRSTSTREFTDSLMPTHPGVEMRSDRYGLGPFASRYSSPLGYDSSGAVRMNEQMIDDNDEEMYEVAVYKDRNSSRSAAADKRGASKFRKKCESPIADETTDSFIGIPISGRNELHDFCRNKAVNQLSDIKVLTAKPSNSKKLKYPENYPQLVAENNSKFGKGPKSNSYMKGSQTELVDGSDPAWLNRQPGGLFPADLTGGLNAKLKRWKVGQESVDINANDNLFYNNHKIKTFQDKLRSRALQNGGRDGAGSRGIRSFARTEDTESDSSEHLDEGEDDNPLMRSKWAYPSGVPDLKYTPERKKAKSSKKDKKESSARNMDDYGRTIEMMNLGQKGKMHDVGYLNTFPSKNLDEIYFPGPGNVIGNNDRHQFYPLARNGHIEGNYGDGFRMPSFMTNFTIDRRMEGELHHDSGVSQSSYMHNYNFDNDMFWTRTLAADNGVPFQLGKKGLMAEPSMGHHLERSDAPLIGCDSLSKKRKIKDESTYLDRRRDNCDYHAADAQLQPDDASMQRKHGKNKLDEPPGGLENGAEAPFMELEKEEREAEIKPQKKSFPLIIPTVLTGFSFSIIHLLSAVRMAMVTLLPEDTSEAGKQLEMNDGGQGVKEENDSRNGDAIVVFNANTSNDDNMSAATIQPNVPTLTIQEIVSRVRSNPGDPCILETQEPLQDLVRGVLKIFSSRTAPLGAKGWKPLVIYEKSNKSWSWIGPFTPNLSDSEAAEEVTSPDAWGLPHKMLVKLVDSFANWLKNSQDTLQQIGSLPPPPSTLMQSNLDEKERFKDLRAQKSLSTINPSSEEVRDYFRKEEVLRYLIPDRAFSYTAVDGKKSIVAPLRRCGGKPTSKARDHFMLKRDRPPHVTILCLVRDAAARLPGSIGTRADVCTLIRDSQYIVEDVSDAQVNQVVSGALDRLHYERDPCVQFDGERKLWVYLHREREEEDFEDDGTSSTKKWRRQKKEVTEPSEPGDVTVAYPGPEGHPGFDLGSDLNMDAACADDDKRSEPDCQDGSCQVEDNTETSHGSGHGMHNAPAPAIWDGIGLNSMEDTKLLCQENSTNEDFVDDAFGGDPPA